MYKQETKHNIEKVCRHVGIESDTAMTVFDSVYDEDFKYKWGKKKAAIGSVAVAIRAEGLPYEIGSIGEAFEPAIPEKEVYKVYKGVKDLSGFEQELPSPLNFVDRLYDEGVGDKNTVELAKAILVEGEEVCRSKSAMVMAGSAYYLAGRMLQQGITQEEIAETVDVTVQIIRKRHAELSKAIDSDEFSGEMVEKLK